MDIGSGWTKKSEKGNIFISVSLDETVLELVPQLKNCRVLLTHIPEDKRKTDKSPVWRVCLVGATKKTETKQAEAQVTQEAQTAQATQQTSNDELISEDEIPF